MLELVSMFDIGSQYQLISEMHIDIDSLMFKGRVFRLWKKHVYLNLF